MKIFVTCGLLLVAHAIIGYDGKQAYRSLRSKVKIKQQVVVAPALHAPKAPTAPSLRKRKITMLNKKKPSLDLLAVARLAKHDPGTHKVLQEVHALAEKSVQLQDPTFAASSIATIHEALWSLAKTDADPATMGAVDSMRAEMCAGRQESEDCTKFMKENCKPGKDKQMDGDAGEVTTGKGFCKSFFPEEKKEEEKKEEEKEEPKAEKIEETAEEPKVQPAEEPKVQQAEEPKVQPTVKQMPHSVKRPLPVPEQGFEGPPVTHTGATQNADWRAEYGPRMETYKEICRERPNNLWCVKNGYAKASATMLTVPVAIMLALF